MRDRADPGDGTDDGSRIEADRVLVARIVADRFAGPAYTSLIDRLARYGLRVCEGWLSSGLIFRESARRGRPVGHSPRDWCADDRTELALETVGVALREFHDSALVRGEWRPEAGASLKTYFIGRCILVFPNVFRRWAREHRGWERIELGGDEVQALSYGGRLVEDLVTDRIELRHRLAALDRRTAAAIALTADGYSQAEIGEVLQVTARAVEALLYRHRTAQGDDGKGGGRDDAGTRR